MSSQSARKLVAFVIGAGKGVGASVGALLRENGYKVALGSRSVEAGDKADESYLYVKVDVSKRDSIEAAFDTVTEKLGPVNVVVYNAASFNAPPIEGDILSLSLDTYYDAVSVGLGAFTAAKKALSGFRSDVHKHNPKTFIATGNILPFSQESSPQYFTLGAQKAVETRFIATAAKAYEKENIQFYFATLVSKEGGIPPYPIFQKSGPTHAQVYWNLINNEKQAQWDHRFTPDGATFAHA